jgi:preprotein translocase subunit Sss1
LKIGLIVGGVVLLGIIGFVIYKSSKKWKRYYQF